MKKYHIIFLFIGVFSFCQKALSQVNPKDTINDSNYYASKLITPLRDVLYFNDIYPGSSGTYVPPSPQTSGTCRASCGTGIHGFCDAGDNSVPFIYDYYGNKIQKLGIYGSDARQKYYIYFPPNAIPSGKGVYTLPVVFLIHGGGWMIGPDPTTISGYPLSVSGNTTDNLVHDLLNQNYVVVSILYRLSSYGDNATEIPLNTIHFQDQINDIDAAITSVQANLRTCMNTNVQSVQVIGESAGGHLALMWAYTKANNGNTATKSVIAMYPPTDLQAYGTLIQNPTGVHVFSCNDFYLLNLHLPYYFPDDISTPTETRSSVNPLVCKENIFEDPAQNVRVMKTYNMVESPIGHTISTPSTDNDLLTYSTSNALVATRIIPTFIMHGRDDQLVPYDETSANKMANRLANTTYGGLIGTYYFRWVQSTSTFTNDAIPTSYLGSTKHMIKLFDKAGHGWASYNAGQKTSITNQVRTDVITWLNGHKI